jgi:hypothetical protein
MKTIKQFVDLLPEKFTIDDVPRIVPVRAIDDDYTIYSHMMIHDAIHYITEYETDPASEIEVAKIEIYYGVGAYAYRKNDEAYIELLNVELQDPTILKTCTLPKILDVAEEICICLNGE